MRFCHSKGPASTKADIPTAEQILGKLLGAVKKAPDATPVQLQSESTAPQSLPLLYPNNPQARSPLKTALGNIPLIPNGAQGATPQTEDNPGWYSRNSGEKIVQPVKTSAGLAGSGRYIYSIFTVPVPPHSPVRLLR